MRDIKNELVDYLSSLCNSDFIVIANTYLEANNDMDSRIEYNGEEFINNQSSSAYDAIVKVEFGDYRTDDIYATLDGCGNFKSSNNPFTLVEVEDIATIIINEGDEFNFIDDDEDEEEGE